MSTINPRNRPLAQVSRAATQPARITQASRPTTPDPALNAWIGAMHEWRHVREGGGNPFEKVLTGRDLVAMGLATSTQITHPSTPARREAPGVVVQDSNGASTVVGYEEFAASIRGTRLYHDLVRKIDDPTRFDELHARTKAALLEELAPIDGKIRGEIRRVEEIATSAKESLAQEVTTIRASVARAAAGVRQVRAASANENRATAAQVTTVTARLDGFDGGAATVEEVMSAIADRATGLEAQYTLKVTAGGAMAGFGLAATDSGSGNATSAFIIQADKFAIVSSSYAGGLDTTPDAANVPFGVDASGVYINAPLFVNGTTGMSLVNGTDVGKIRLDASGNLVIEGTAANKSIQLLAPNGGGLSVDDYTVVNQSSVGVLRPGETTASIVITAGTEGAVASVGRTLVLRAGSLGSYPINFACGSAETTNTGVVTNWNADRVDSYHAGNSSGQVAVSNGTVCTNLNADTVDGYHSTSLCSIVNGNTGTATASGSGFTMQMGTGLAPTYEVNCSGNNIILQTASDRTLKQDIEDEAHGMGFIRALRPRRFRFISDPEYMQHGFIAQEMAAVATPNGEKDSLAFTREDGIMGINHLMLFAPVVKALQEIDARLTAIGA
jgi:hypothetical protein